MHTADPADRALALLSLLQTGRAWTGSELAVRLEISARTVRRDADRLRSLGYLIETRPGPGGVYRLGAGSVLPPLLFADDEVTAVVAGLRMIQHRLGTDDPAERALVKLVRVLPARLRAVAAAAGVATEAVPGRDAALSTQTIAALAEATTGSGRVRFSYRDQHDQPSARLVEPYRQVFLRDNWYLLGFDLDRNDWRTFRLDRVHDVERVAGTFARQELPADSVAAYLGTDFARASIPVSIIFDATANAVTGRLPRLDAELEPLPENRCRYRTHVASLAWFAATTAALNIPFHVEQPPDLAQHCRILGALLDNAAERGTTGSRPARSG